MKELNLLLASLLNIKIFLLNFIILRIIIQVTTKNGTPMARNKTLLTAPKIRAVSCSKMIVIPTSKSAVTLVSILSIFLYKLRAFLLLDADKMLSIFRENILEANFLTMRYPDIFKYKLKTNIFKRLAHTKVIAVTPYLRVIM